MYDGASNRYKNLEWSTKRYQRLGDILNARDTFVPSRDIDHDASIATRQISSLIPFIVDNLLFDNIYSRLTVVILKKKKNLCL